MHVSSKKDLSSGELDSLKRSRTPTTVVTASGEVQTNEEPQVWVYDLHIFVTLQLLEDTPAVLFLGKLCKGHGYTHERPNGREPRLTKKMGSRLSAKPGTSFFLVVPGISSSSTTTSSSTSPPQDLSISLDPANTRGNEGATGNCSEEVAENCSEGIPEWLEDFTENLQITEIPAAADISHDSDPERPTKGASRKHSIHTHFPKDQNCEVCKRTKTTDKGSLQKVTWRSSTPRRKMVKTITDTHEGSLQKASWEYST